MPDHPYQQQQNTNYYAGPRGNTGQYRQGDAPFQFPWWSILLCLVLDLWPLGLGFLIANRVLREKPRTTTRTSAKPTTVAGVPVYAQNVTQSKGRRQTTTAKRKAVVDDSTKTARALLVCGAVLLAFGVMVTADELDMLLWALRNGYQWAYYIEDVLAGVMMMGGGLGALVGARVVRTNGRMRKRIANIVGKADHMYIRDIAGALQCDYAKCLKHVEKCIDKGIFGPDAYIDMRTGCLVVRGPAPLAQPQPEPEQKAAEPAGDQQYQEILAELRRVNEAIPGQEMTAKISRLETVSARIFEQVSADPKKLPQMRKFMDYYLPTSLKLLNTYAELDAQPVDGENIRVSKQQIEQVMDTVVQAFENQLDQLFRTDAMDVSADIEVMQNMLRADGLVDGGFPAAPQGPRLEL